MKCSLGISNFLEEISSLSLSVVFLCIFALIAKEGFLISPCYSLELRIQMGISFLFSFAFSFSFLFLCKALYDNHFAFLHFFFLSMASKKSSSHLTVAFPWMKVFFFLWTPSLLTKTISKDSNYSCPHPFHWNIHVWGLLCKLQWPPVEGTNPLLLAN